MYPIHHTFAPLADNRQVRRALGISYAPWRYKRGKSVNLLERGIARHFQARTFLLGSGREALLALLLALELQPGDEVIVQGYTCIVVPNAIQAAGGTVVFCDIEQDTLNLDIDRVAAAITPRTRAVICQHTFGIPSNASALRRLCTKHGILFIEDCAHTIPDATDTHEIGRLGDAVILSFGRDKAISGVAGGALVLRDPLLTETVEQHTAGLRDFSWLHINHLLVYPLVYRRALPLYGIGIGKAIVRAQRALGNLVPVTSEREKHGIMDTTLHRMPNGCAFLAIDQWNRLQALNDHRRKLTDFYLDACHRRGWLKKDSPVHIPSAIAPDLPLQKFPLFVKNAEEIRRRLKKRNIYLDDGWTGCVVCPSGADERAVGYGKGSDRCAEAVAESILSLPTHPTMTVNQAKRLLDALGNLVI